jgi:2-polyprenyl-3-methyl-5-hydroxy-6-metoxy-1,4-benzoquinol methylase
VDESIYGEDCPACGGPGRDRGYQVEGLDLYRCRLCRTEYFVRRPGREHTKDYWDGYKLDLYADEVVQAEYEARYDEIIGRVRAAYPRIESVLDIGCGIGNFVDWAGRHGLRAIGSDVDPTAVAEARERGLDVHVADELAENVAAESVDMVTLWDVIEHVYEPRELLASALVHLKPGGVVVMETPDVRFPLRPFVIAVRKVAEPIRWSDALYFAGHKVYFSPRGLSTLMARCDLEVVDQLGMRSPNAKMASQFEYWAANGTMVGRIGSKLYQPLDRTMRTARINNKLIMVGRKPA